MENRKRPAAPSNSGSVALWASSFQRQPARVLIVEALPPWWSQTSKVLCDALDNFFSLACNLEGPRRIPLLSLYAVSRQQECLLPFVVRANLARLRSCVQELRSLPGEGSIPGAGRAGELLRRTVLDGLQQFKQYIRHRSDTDVTSVEVTVVTSQPGQGIVCRCEAALKDADLVSLKRLLVVQIDSGGDPGQDATSADVTHAESEESLLLGTEVDLQRVENSVFALESVLKSWLQEQGGDREHLHLLLPSPGGSPRPVCVKCDVQERLISPALIPIATSLEANTETVQDFLSVAKGPTNQSPAPQRARVIKILRAEGVCESVLYGLPLVICPTACWQLDWEEMESNHSLFHALCHTLMSRDLFLLLQVEPVQRSTAQSSGVCSHYVLQPSTSLTLLLKPVASRELLLPCRQPVSAQDPAPEAMQTVQGCLTQLDEEFVFKPLSVSSNLYQHLRNRGVASQPRYPYREQLQPAEGAKGTAGRQNRQPHNQSRQLGSSGKVRATVAPMPSSSVPGPPSAKASRLPALTLHSSSGGSGGSGGGKIHRGPAPSPPEEDSDDLMIIY